MYFLYVEYVEYDVSLLFACQWLGGRLMARLDALRIDLLVSFRLNMRHKVRR